MIPYMGGDTRLADYILSLLPRADTLLEAFGGGGSVSLKAADLGLFKHIIWNDLDFYTYSAFYVIKHHPEVIQTIHEVLNFVADCLEKGDRETVKDFVKDIVKDLERGKVSDVVEAGFYTLVIHSICSNTLGYRIRWPSTPQRYRTYALRLYRYNRLLTRIEIMNRDAFEVIPEFDRPSVVMYLDPPHIIEWRGQVGYYRLSFRPSDAARLDKLLSELKYAKVLLKLSPQDLKYYRNVCTTFHKVEKKYRKHASDSRATGTYYFFMNYEVKKTPTLLEYL